MIDFGEVTARIEAGDADGVAALLLAGEEKERCALAAVLKEFAFASVPGPPDEQPWTAWERDSARRAALVVAGVGCLPRAADIVSWLRSDRYRGVWTLALGDVVVRVLRAPGRPSLAAVAGGLAQKLRPANVRSQWHLVARLIDEAGLPVPATEATMTGWMQEVNFVAGASVADRLRTDPRTAYLLPEIFRIPRLGARLWVHGADGLALLAADSDAQRRTILDGCRLRLRAGDRPGAIEPMVNLHRLLGPTADECADGRQEYLGMLSSPATAVAGLALTVLRAVHGDGRLESEAVTEAAYAILPRKEKKLVRAMLEWIDEVLAAGVDLGLYAALLTGLGNAATDLAEQALKLAAAHLPAYGPEALTEAAAGLEGDLRSQADAILGRTGTPAAPIALLRLGPSGPMPPPIATLAELAGECATANRRGTDDPVLLERVLDGLTRFAYAERDALARLLTPMLGEFARGYWVDGPMYAVVHGVPRRGSLVVAAGVPPQRMLNTRIAELTRQLCGTPPPALLATPATVDGHTDPERVRALLVAAEQDGWQPGAYDLQNALLRLPRDTRPDLGDGLRSPAGKSLAERLRHGGLPDPSVRAVSVERRLCDDHRPGDEDCWCLQKPPLRRTVVIDTPGGELFHMPESGAYERAYDYVEDYRTMRFWPMVLPSHREILAAHALPRLTTCGDGIIANHLEFLPGIAAADGPFGPAMALCLAYGLTAGRPAGREHTADAFVVLAARGILDGAMVGRELGILFTGRSIVLKRVADGLTQALRAGAAAEVWNACRELVAAVLSVPKPGAGAPDLLMLAAAAAAAAHATDDVLPARELTGSGRLATEAARLIRTLDANRLSEAEAGDRPS